MTDWAAIYAPLIGSRIEALKWRSLTCDTPTLIEEFARPSFSFTGATELVFEGDRSLFLTWRQRGYTMVLAGALDSPLDWTPHSLDSVRANPEDPWGLVEQSILTGVRFFSLNAWEEHPVAAVRHEIRVAQKIHTFWITVGGYYGVGDQDDLWVAADHEPPNMADLIEVQG